MVNRTKIKNLLTVVVVISLILIVNVGYEQILAQLSPANAKLYVDPEKVEDPALLPGSRFWINIVIYNVTDMRTCRFNLSFAPTMLAITGVLVQPVQGQYPLAYIDSNSEKGYVYAELTYVQSVTLPQIKASLLAIQFTVKDYGITVLDLHDTVLKNSNGDGIPHEVGDGLVWIKKHDIAVIGVFVSPNVTYAGRMVNITSMVKNKGNVAENFTVNVFVNETLIGTFNVVNLNLNETRELTLNWNTTGFAPSKTSYVIKSEASVVLGEKNVTNNVYFAQVRLKIIGDVNGDDIVDINDLIAWDLAFNSKSGDQNWNPQADINGDGAVDKEDGILIVQNYHNEL
jgi:hypothetical protein